MKIFKFFIVAGLLSLPGLAQSQTAQTEAVDAALNSPSSYWSSDYRTGSVPKYRQRLHPPTISPVLEDKMIKGAHGIYIRGGSGRFSAESMQRAKTKILREAAIESDIEVDTSASCLCGPEPDEKRALADQMYEQIICKQEFIEEVWDSYTPPQDKLPSKKISLAEAKRYLIRFAKIDGYKSEKHQNILKAILGNPEVVKAFPKEVFFAVQMVSYTKDSGEFMSIFQSLPLPPIPPYKESDVCRSEAETLAIRKSAVEGALNTAKMISNDTAMAASSWWQIQMSIPSLNAGPPEAKTEVKNKMYRTMATGAVQYQYKGLFMSKALLFTKSYVNKVFGDPAKEFSDLAVVSEGGKTEYYLLGTSKVESGGSTSTTNMYGFESLDLRGPATPAIGKSKDLPVSWKHQGETYSANVKLHSKATKGLVSEAKAPDYDKMWADKKMSGVVLVSDNLGEFKAKATEHYIQYYAEKGFNFEEPQNVTDTEQWLQKNISDGTVDYVLKDAHSGGNTSYLMNFSKSHKILKGTKSLPDGKTEVVYIMAPGAQGDTEGQKLRYDDMKDWMKKRQQDDKGPLVYLNSSCWSLDQAKFEVPAVENPLFINIASTSKTTTFVNSKDSTKYHIMDGIREGQTYEQIRKGMSQTTRHKTGTNQFKFPDDAVYQKMFEKITEVQVEVKDSKGKEYNLEDAAH